MKPVFACLFLLLLVGCGGGNPPPATLGVTLGVEPTATAGLAALPTAIIAPTQVPNPTATLDARLPAEQWQEWPVIPAMTGRGMEIYRQGLALGVNPHAFSKVGDCQNVKEAFMGFFDLPDRYNLGTDYQYLQETIDQFSGYFNTDGQAVKGGFNAATVLSPLWASPEVCLAGENPLECELRVTRPAIVFISFEVWWEGRTSEEYEGYMRQIIETVIASGAVPVLATKADNVEGDHSLNLTTARLAHEYDLPLWNFWLAVQSLPNQGLDAERNDGFHISTDGWNVRSFTGLQTLDSIWQGARTVAGGDPIQPTATPDTDAVSGLLPPPAGGPTLAGPGERLVFGLAAREGSGYAQRGVYLYDFSTQRRAQILGSGWDFQAGSQDGKFLLVNQGRALYLTDGKTLTLISEHFYPEGGNGALFLPNGDFVFIGTEGGEPALTLAGPDGSGDLVVSQPTDRPIEVYPGTDGRRIAWDSGTCSAVRVCDRQGAWLTDLETRQSWPLDGILHPLISPDGMVMAYEFIPGENQTNLAFATVEGLPTRTYPVFGDILAGSAWQNSGDWLAVHMAVRSDYSGRVTDGVNFLVNPETFATQQLPSVLLLNPILAWSQEDTSMAWMGTDWLNNEYSIRLFKVEIESGEADNHSGYLDLSESGYVFVTHGSWLAEP